MKKFRTPKYLIVLIIKSHNRLFKLPLVYLLCRQGLVEVDLVTFAEVEFLGIFGVRNIFLGGYRVVAAPSPGVAA